MGGSKQQHSETRRAMAMMRRVARSGDALLDMLDKAQSRPDTGAALDALIKGPDTGATLAQLLTPKTSSDMQARKIRAVSPELPKTKSPKSKAENGLPKSTTHETRRAVPQTAKTATQKDGVELARRALSSSDVEQSPRTSRPSQKLADISDPQKRLKTVADMRQRLRKATKAINEPTRGDGPGDAGTDAAKPATVSKRSSEPTKSGTAKSFAEFAQKTASAARSVSPVTVSQAQTKTVAPALAHSKIGEAEGTFRPPEGNEASAPTRETDTTRTPPPPKETGNTPPPAETRARTEANTLTRPPAAPNQRRPDRPEQSAHRLPDAHDSLARAAWRNGVEPQ